MLHKIEDVEVTTKQTSDGSEEEASSDTETAETPVNPPKITSIKVETYGVDYGLPETLEPFDYMSWIYSQYGIDPNTLAQ